jgi:hypothetical protein
MIPENKFVLNNTPVLQRRRRGNILSLLAALSILGPSTMNDCAKWALKQTNLSKREEPKIGEVKGKHRNVPVQVYSLTLRGSILSLGYEFNSSQWQKFIKNVSYNSLFFSYINKILENTSFNIVERIFLKPIQNLVTENKIDVNDDREESDELRYNFSIIAERIGRSLYQTREEIARNIEKSDSRQAIPFLADNKHIETLMLHTWYHIDMLSWSTEAQNYFYSHIMERNFFEQFSDKANDVELTYKTMQQICNSYYGSPEFIPERHKEISAHRSGFNKGSQVLNDENMEIEMCDTCRFLQQWEKPIQ